MTELRGFTITHTPTATTARLILPFAAAPKQCVTLGSDPSCSVVLSGRDVAPFHAHFYGKGHHRYVRGGDGDVGFPMGGSPLQPGEEMRVDGIVFLIGAYEVHHGSLESNAPTDFARHGATALHRFPFNGRDATSRVNYAAAALGIPVHDWEAFAAVRVIAAALWFEDLTPVDLNPISPRALSVAPEAVEHLRTYLDSPEAIARLAWVLDRAHHLPW